MQYLLSSPAERASEAARTQLLQLFVRLLSLEGLEASLSKALGAKRRGFYRRLWCPIVTLWYLLWQRLHEDHTLKAVISDARHGGADALRPGKKPLSERIRSVATSAYSKARQRLPWTWVQDAFLRLAQGLRALGPALSELPLQLWDGSTLRMRRQGDIAKHFPPHRTRRKDNYWCVARVVVGFCAATGLALAAQMGSIYQSEQALAVQLILAGGAALHLGDRNFGVWRIVQAAVQSQGQALVRLTAARAKKLAAGRCLKRERDLVVTWTPSSHDQVDKGLKRRAVEGRLVVVRVKRRGFRPQRLYLFTTLLDTQAYPPQRLAQLYAVRWTVELNFRSIKDTLGLGQLEVKSAAMARKEFYAGLMASNLIRGVMAVAARSVGCAPAALSLATARAHLVTTLHSVWLSRTSQSQRQKDWQWLLEEVSRARLPRRRKERPSEPRRQRPVPRKYPVLHGSRAQARRQLKKQQAKS